MKASGIAGASAAWEVFQMKYRNLPVQHNGKFGAFHDPGTYIYSIILSHGPGQGTQRNDLAANRRHYI